MGWSKSLRPHVTVLPTPSFKERTRDTIRGIGLNGKPSLKGVASRPIPSWMQLLGGTLASGQWLNLGDEPGVDERDQIVSGQGNIGLMAALLLTIQFSFMFVIPDIRMAFLEASWIVQQLGDGSADVIYEIMLTVNMVATVFCGLCTVYTVMIILMCGEMTGAAEVTLLSNILGWRINGSIALFIFSIAMSAVLYIFFNIVACASLVGVILNTILCVAVVCIVLIVFYVPLIQAGYQAKALNASNSPLTLTSTEIEAMFQEFCQTVGDSHVSLGTFEDYLAILVREKELGAGNTKMMVGDREAQGKGEDAALKVMSLSSASRDLAQRRVQRHLDTLAIKAQSERAMITFTKKECVDLVKAYAAQVGEETVSPEGFMNELECQLAQARGLNLSNEALESLESVTAKTIALKVQATLAKDGMKHDVDIAYISKRRLKKEVEAWCEAQIDNS